MTRTVLACSRRDQRKAFKSRVWLNGVEVTNDCQTADDRIGRVLLLKRNEQGRHYINSATQEIAKEWHHGSVRMATKRAS